MTDNVTGTGSGGVPQTFRAFADASGVEWPAEVLAFVTGGSAGGWTLQYVGPNNPLPVTSGAPYKGTPLGYQQLSVSSSASGLTVPTGATFCVISVEGEPVRWRDDGTTPTSTVGMPLQVGQQLSYSASLSAIEFIAQTGSATLDIAYYK